MTTRPEDAEEELKVLSDALHERYDPVLDEAVPERLRQAARPRLRPYAIAAGWIALGVAVGIVAGWQLHSQRTSGPVPQAEAATLVRRAAIAHATYSPEVRHPVEVGADQEAHLVAWLSKRLGASVRAPHLESVGYKLIGGRLLPGDKGPVAQFMFGGAKGERLTLYVTREDAGRETAFKFGQDGPVNVFYWVDKEFGYAISSGDSKSEMLRVAEAVYSQLEVRK